MSEINDSKIQANVLNYARKAFSKTHDAVPVVKETVGGAEDGKKTPDVVLKPLPRTDGENLAK